MARSQFGDIILEGTYDAIIKGWEGRGYGYEKIGDNYMMHICRNYADHYKRVQNDRNGNRDLQGESSPDKVRGRRVHNRSPKSR